ncbi:MAG: BlaI/MecI/CopY family transcriptional regulator [Eubacteriales bacterium]|nr:BlaI/MecI/CopY family transcriptional regulator [Eubacteriales bacterium]
MEEIMEKITDCELEVLKVLWTSDSALPLSVIRSTLQATMDWEAATIKTLLARLVSKSAVLQEKREIFYYSPLVTEKAYNTWATARLINRLYKGKASNLVAALLNTDGISKDDIAELRQMFSEENK